MSTISDAMKKKRDEEPRPSAETAGPRVVQVRVPRDHTARNLILVVVFGAVVLVGAVVGGYALRGRIKALEHSRTPDVRPPVTEEPAGVVETGTGRTGPESTTERTPDEPASAQTALPALKAIFPDAVNPSAVLNDRRVHLGDVVNGYRVVAIEEERVRLERDGRKYDLTIE
jgi:hypothetical protein